MRKHYFKSLLALLCVSALLFCANTSDAAWREQLTVGELTVEQSLTVQGLLQAAANTTGRVYYVNSSGGINSPGAWGEAFSQPLATIEYAINRCTASKNDFIIVMPGHTESYTAAAGATNGGFDADIAGITIIGLGNGANAPTLTFADTDATVAIGAANVTVANIRFLAGISDIVIGIAVEAGGDNFTLLECNFPVPGTVTFEFLDVIDLESGANDFSCIGNVYRDGSSSATNHFIEAGNGVNTNLKIIRNDIYGRFAISTIWSDTIDTGALIQGNIIANTISGQHAVEFTTTASGMIVDNRFYTDDFSTTLDPGSMYCMGNISVSSIDEGGTVIPVESDSGSQGEKSASGSTAVMVNGDTIFTVAGGPIEILSLISECITVNDGTASTLQYTADPTVGAATTFSGASASLANAAAGSGAVLNMTATATAPDLIDPLVGLTAVHTRGIVVGAGVIKIVIGTGSTTGTWKHYIRYRPLARGVTVTGT